MNIITIVNRRGGVGKTATAHAIGAGLAHLGYKILFIDLDSQTNLSYDLAADQSRYSAMDLLTGSATAEQIIQHKDKWDLIPASPALSTADAVITSTGKEYRLKEALQPISALYDYCIIDTPPALNTLTVNALTAATGAIIPAQAEIHSIQGIGLLNETIEQVRRYCNNKLLLYGIVITRYNGRAILSKDMKSNLEAAADQLGTKVYSTPIRECIALKEAQATQQDIFTYAPSSNAAKDYAALLAEIISHKRRTPESVYKAIRKEVRKAAQQPEREV